MRHTDGDRAAEAQCVNLKEEQRGNVAWQSGLDHVGIEHCFDEHGLQVGHGCPTVLESSADGRAEAAQQRHLDVGDFVAASVDLASATHHAVEHGQTQIH